MARVVGPLVVCAFCAVVAAFCDNEIRLWEGVLDHCTIDQHTRRVTVTWPGVYKLEAVDGTALGDINRIEAVLDANAPAGPSSSASNATRTA